MYGISKLIQASLAFFACLDDIPLLQIQHYVVIPFTAGFMTQACKLVCKV